MTLSGQQLYNKPTELEWQGRASCSHANSHQFVSSSVLVLYWKWMREGQDRIKEVQLFYYISCIFLFSIMKLQNSFLVTLHLLY